MGIDTKPDMSTESEDDAAGRSPVMLRLESALDYPNALARVAQYILENPKKVIRLSLAELSFASKSGQATIFRLCRELGYKGFTDFKLALATEIGQREAQIAASSDTAEDYLGETEALICRSVASTRRLTRPDALDLVARRMLQSSLINIYGSGESGVMAELFSYRLLGVGLNAHAPRNARLACDVAAALPAEAVAVGISQSGASSDTLEFMQTARDAGAFTVALTCYPKSSIAQHSEVILQMARFHLSRSLRQMIGIPKVIFVAEALATVISDLKAREEAGEG